MEPIANLGLRFSSAAEEGKRQLGVPKELHDFASTRALYNTQACKRKG